MTEALRKILVVDDNVANLTVLNGILSGLYKVYPVDSGAIALKFLEKQRPDLILLDVEMPEMSGPELFHILHADTNLSSIPVIFLTGNTDIESEAEAFKLGAADFMRKPVNDVIVLSRVRTQLELQDYRSSSRPV